MHGQSLKDVKRIEPTGEIEDGSYAGKWSGYVIKWETPYGAYEAKTETGVRGIDVPCTVLVQSGDCSFVRP